MSILNDILKKASNFLEQGDYVQESTGNVFSDFGEQMKKSGRLGLDLIREGFKQGAGEITGKTRYGLERLAGTEKELAKKRAEDTEKQAEKYFTPAAETLVSGLSAPILGWLKPTEQKYEDKAIQTLSTIGKVGGNIAATVPLLGTAQTAIIGGIAKQLPRLAGAPVLKNLSTVEKLLTNDAFVQKAAQFLSGPTIFAAMGQARPYEEGESRIKNLITDALIGGVFGKLEGVASPLARGTAIGTTVAGLRLAGPTGQALSGQEVDWETAVTEAITDGLIWGVLSGRRDVIPLAKTKALAEIGVARPKEFVDTYNAYRTLESLPGESLSAVKKKYKGLVHKYHPDKPGGSQAKMIEINNAYELIQSAHPTTRNKIQSARETAQRAEEATGRPLGDQTVAETTKAPTIREAMTEVGKEIRTKTGEKIRVVPESIQSFVDSFKPLRQAEQTVTSTEGKEPADIITRVSEKAREVAEKVGEGPELLKREGSFLKDYEQARKSGAVSESAAASTPVSIRKQPEVSRILSQFVDNPEDIIVEWKKIPEPLEGTGVSTKEGSISYVGDIINRKTGEILASDAIYMANSDIKETGLSETLPEYFSTEIRSVNQWSKNPGFQYIYYDRGQVSRTVERVKEGKAPINIVRAIQKQQGPQEITDASAERTVSPEAARKIDTISDEATILDSDIQAIADITGNSIENVKSDLNIAQDAFDAFGRQVKFGNIKPVEPDTRPPSPIDEVLDLTFDEIIETSTKDPFVGMDAEIPALNPEFISQLNRGEVPSIEAFITPQEAQSIIEKHTETANEIAKSFADIGFTQKSLTPQQKKDIGLTRGEYGVYKLFEEGATRKLRVGEVEPGDEGLPQEAQELELGAASESIPADYNSIIDRLYTDPTVNTKVTRAWFDMFQTSGDSALGVRDIPENRTLNAKDYTGMKRMFNNAVNKGMDFVAPKSVNEPTTDRIEAVTNAIAKQLDIRVKSDIQKVLGTHYQSILLLNPSAARLLTNTTPEATITDLIKIQKFNTDTPLENQLVPVVDISNWNASRVSLFVDSIITNEMTPPVIVSDLNPRSWFWLPSFPQKPGSKKYVPLLDKMRQVPFVYAPKEVFGMQQAPITRQKVQDFLSENGKLQYRPSSFSVIIGEKTSNEQVATAVTKIFDGTAKGKNDIIHVPIYAKRSGKFSFSDVKGGDMDAAPLNFMKRLNDRLNKSHDFGDTKIRVYYTKNAAEQQIVDSNGTVKHTFETLKDSIKSKAGNSIEFIKTPSDTFDKLAAKVSDAVHQNFVVTKKGNDKATKDYTAFDYKILDPKQQRTSITETIEASEAAVSIPKGRSVEQWDDTMLNRKYAELKDKKYLNEIEQKTLKKIEREVARRKEAPEEKAALAERLGGERGDIAKEMSERETSLTKEEEYRFADTSRAEIDEMVTGLENKKTLTQAEKEDLSDLRYAKLRKIEPFQMYEGEVEMPEFGTPGYTVTPRDIMGPIKEQAKKVKGQPQTYELAPFTETDLRAPQRTEVKESGVPQPEPVGEPMDVAHIAQGIAQEVENMLPENAKQSDVAETIIPDAVDSFLDKTKDIDPTAYTILSEPVTRAEIIKKMKSLIIGRAQITTEYTSGSTGRKRTQEDSDSGMGGDGIINTEGLMGMLIIGLAPLLQQLLQDRKTNK